jgi:hypothetical protein
MMISLPRDNKNDESTKSSMGTQPEVAPVLKFPRCTALCSSELLKLVDLASDMAQNF